MKNKMFNKLIFCLIFVSGHCFSVEEQVLGYEICTRGLVINHYEPQIINNPESISTLILLKNSQLMFRIPEGLYDSFYVAGKGMVSVIGNGGTDFIMANLVPIEALGSSQTNNFTKDELKCYLSAALIERYLKTIPDRNKFDYFIYTINGYSALKLMTKTGLKCRDHYIKPEAKKVLLISRFYPCDSGKFLDLGVFFNQELNVVGEIDPFIHKTAKSIIKSLSKIGITTIEID